MAGDPLWYYKVLGLHCDGTNGSTTFTDVKGKTVTANGNAQISTAQYPALTGKTSSGYFDGTGDYLSIPDSADWHLGSGDFTIRAHIRLAGYATNNAGTYHSTIVSQDLSTSRAFAFNVTGTSSSFTTLLFMGYSDNSTGTTVSGSYSFALNTWYLVEVCRVGNYVYLFVDGGLLNTGGTAFSRTLQDSSTTLKVGAQEYDVTYKYYLNGYISEVEIYKGVGLHTASYTPSTDPFADEYFSISGTVRDSSGNFASRLVRVYRRDTGALVGSVLSNATTGVWKQEAANTGATVTKHFAVCHDASATNFYRVLGLHCDGTNGSTTFTDVKGKTVTANGNAQISTAWYPTITGKTSSGYLDGSGDYLTVTHSGDLNFGSGDFTIRGRFRFQTTGTLQIIVDGRGTTNDYACAYAFWVNSSNNIVFYADSTGADANGGSWELTLTSTTAISASTEYDIEISRSGNTFRLFVGGTQEASTTQSLTIGNAASVVKIGAGVNGSGTTGYYANMYFSEIEIYKGVALHTANFTPSTDPFTDSTTATENALIYDDLTPT